MSYYYLILFNNYSILIPVKFSLVESLALKLKYISLNINHNIINVNLILLFLEK